MKSFQIVFFLFLLLPSLAFSQKYGHISYGALLADLPETKKADAELGGLRDQMLAKGDTMAKVFEANYIKFSQAYQAGTLSAVDAAKLQNALEKDQAMLQQYEQEIKNAISQRRDELLKPIVDKVQKAIEEVGKEGSYQFIFDSSLPNALLFVQETDDITPSVKKKLGIQ